MSIIFGKVDFIEFEDFYRNEKKFNEKTRELPKLPTKEDFELVPPSKPNEPIRWTAFA